MSAADIKELAISTIKAEAEAIGRLAGYVDEHFERAVAHIYAAKGRVIVTGIGKSAIIANKIVATFNSTGTPAIFMHAADAIHGDLGIIQPDDVVICISKSGNTPEIKVLVPLIQNLGNSIVAIVSNVDSYLGQRADYVLRATVEREACPNNLAPTSSTTPALKPNSQPGSYFVVASCQVMVVVFKPAFTLNESCAEAVVPIAIMATRAKSSVAFFITYRFNEVCSVSKNAVQL